VTNGRSCYGSRLTDKENADRKASAEGRFKVMVTN
jgi:hypothetical protein